MQPVDTTGAIVQGEVSLPRTRVADNGTTLYADYEIHCPVVVFPRDTRGLGLEVSRPTWTQTIVVRVAQGARHQYSWSAQARLTALQNLNTSALRPAISLYTAWIVSHSLRSLG